MVGINKKYLYQGHGLDCVRVVLCHDSPFMVFGTLHVF